MRKIKVGIIQQANVADMRINLIIWPRVSNRVLLMVHN